MTSIYALRLAEGNFYIGRSGNVMKRINQHFKGEGSVWTKLHKPLSIVEIIHNCDNFDEDKYTLMYMSIYGKEKVRGGAFCSIVLGGADKYIIDRMICGATNKCVKCKKPGHFFTDCPLNINKKKIKKTEKTENDVEDDKDDKNQDDKDKDGQDDKDEKNQDSTTEEDEPLNYVHRNKKRKLN